MTHAIKNELNESKRKSIFFLKIKTSLNHSILHTVVINQCFRADDTCCDSLLKVGIM